MHCVYPQVWFMWTSKEPQAAGPWAGKSPHACPRTCPCADPHLHGSTDVTASQMRLCCLPTPCRGRGGQEGTEPRTEGGPQALSPPEHPLWRWHRRSRDIEGAQSGRGHCSSRDA